MDSRQVLLATLHLDSSVPIGWLGSTFVCKMKLFHEVQHSISESHKTKESKRADACIQICMCLRSATQSLGKEVIPYAQ